MTSWQETVRNYLIQYGFQVAGGIAILIVGAVVSRWIGNLLLRWLEKQDLEPPVRNLMSRTARLCIMIFTLLMVLEMVGVKTTSLLAGIGVAGVGLGLAMQGVLGNAVAGLVILFSKPYRVNEYIEVLGVCGQVTQIELFTTTLLHADQSKVKIPNRKIVGEILHNYGTIRQLDLSVGVAFNNDIQTVIQLLREILIANPRVLKTPSPVVGISALGDSSILLGIKPWVNVPDFGAAQLEIYQAIIEQFSTHNIEIPCPQRDIRLLNADSVS